MKFHHFIVVVALSAMLSLGCRPKSSPRPSEPNPQPSDMADASKQISDLQRYSVEPSTVSKTLPGREPDEDRQLLADAFDRATRALTLLIDHEPHGAFPQQLTISDSDRNEVRAGPTSEAQ